MFSITIYLSYTTPPTITTLLSMSMCPFSFVTLSLHPTAMPHPELSACSLSISFSYSVMVFFICDLFFFTFSIFFFMTFIYLFKFSLIQVF